MTGHTQLAITPRDRFLQAAEKELVAFERREREFQKKDREERAAKLQIPLNKIAAHDSAKRRRQWRPLPCPPRRPADAPASHELAPIDRPMTACRGLDFTGGLPRVMAGPFGEIRYRAGSNTAAPAAPRRTGR